MPSSVSAESKLPPSKASVDLRSALPPRFRYKPLEEIEIEDVNFGGSEVLLK